VFPIDSQVISIITKLIEEAQRALQVKAYLSVIFLCGSVLEGALLGAAQKNPSKFNRSSSSPKDTNGNIKQFHCWSLSAFIDVSCDIEILSLNIKKFSHNLRDFRNYIHPYQQLQSKFTPDENTAKICFQVLKAALSDLQKSNREAANR